MNRFTIELTSSHDDWKRFSVKMMCELQDSAGLRTGFLSAESANGGCSTLQTEPCSRVRAFVYAIPESLPAIRDVKRLPDFGATLRIACDGRTVAEESVEVSRFGGLSVERLCGPDGIIGGE